ncbi:MAG: DUF4258 domain-containing protein [Bacteroidetes bacterium]|nr:MAG: DUF4258 domain-containing protein [Bacteroidota bacterium]
MKKAAPLILILILAAALLVIRNYKGCNQPDPGKKITTNDTRNDNKPDVNRDLGFDRRTSFLEYSNHAKCRMQCRKISQAEVEEIMLDGNINYNKSDIKNARCPRYALEGITKDNQRVRIVYAQCNDKTEVVTVIDLETDWSCSCPGDDKKFENRN